VPLRWLLVDDEDAVVALCADVDGIFRDRRESGVAVLRGCRPEPPLRRALDALARGAGRPGGALHRRQIDVSLLSVADDGTVTRPLGADLRASVCAAHPSVVGDGLLDVTFDTPVTDPMPTRARAIWELRWAGGPTERGQWVGYDGELRHQWSAAALVHARGNHPDQPAGSTYHLDGRHVTDIDGFWCALGEAINGPGGYFGWNLDALDDCLRGRWGAATPFTLIWHDSAVARTYLDTARDRRAGHTVEQICQLFSQNGVAVELTPARARAGRCRPSGPR